jgi:hypothetical protein
MDNSEHHTRRRENLKSHMIKDVEDTIRLYYVAYGMHGASYWTRDAGNGGRLFLCAVHTASGVGRLVLLRYVL